MTKEQWSEFIATHVAQLTDGGRNTPREAIVMAFFDGMREIESERQRAVDALVTARVEAVDRLGV